MNLTKKLKQLRCSQILAKGPHVVGREDFFFLMSEVFPLHERWDEKQGVGVSHIEVRQGVYKQHGFHIVRTDGSDIDISYRVALYGSGTVNAKIMSAARGEVVNQISDWRMNNPPPAPGMHCDHNPIPFDELFRRWLDVVGISKEEIRTTSQSVGWGDAFHERALATSWQRYHLKHARYQWLEAAENIRKSNSFQPELFA